MDYGLLDIIKRFYCLTSDSRIYLNTYRQIRSHAYLLGGFDSYSNRAGVEKCHVIEQFRWRDNARMYIRLTWCTVFCSQITVPKRTYQHHRGTSEL